nr:type II toxin-antitoxin system prevent-host-death family antitoxin [Frankia sp. Cas3]
MYYTGLMEQVPVRVLNQDTAGVLARVEHGETIEITRHGKVIGRIVPATPGELDDLIAAGKVAPATVTGPFIAPQGPLINGLEAGALIRQLRDEERW